MFRRTLTANDKYPFQGCKKFLSFIQMQLSLKQKLFFILFSNFRNIHQTLNILKKQTLVITTLLRKLETVKDLFRPLSEKYLFRTPFDSKHVKGSQTLVKSAWEHFHHIFSLPWENQTWKISRLAICYILGVFCNTSTAIEKYPIRDWEFGNYRLSKTWLDHARKKHRFRAPFESQHVKRHQALVKSSWEHFHHIFSSLWENLIWKKYPLVIC